MKHQSVNSISTDIAVNPLMPIFYIHRTFEAHFIRKIILLIKNSIILITSIIIIC